MWSSTSDNKKSEEVDCKCDSASTAAHACDHNTGQQQQQLNTFENSSKKDSTTFGGNLTEQEKALKKEKELAGVAAETSDSGFISGPQTNIFHDDDDSSTPAVDETETTTARTHKFNITPNQEQDQKQQQQQHKSQLQEEKIVLDSGCIDEDFTEEIEDYDDVDITVQKAEVDEQLAAEQVQNELSNKTVTAVKTNNSTSINAAAAAAISTGTAIDNQQQPQQQQQQQPQMILKQNVDSGMSEWFCKLNLQNEASTQSAPQQQQQQQQHVAGISMNNLDAAGRKLVANLNSSKQHQQQSQSQAAGNSATTTNTATTTTTTTNVNLTPSNAWEQFYQQNDDGDTPMHLACISGFVDIVAALIRMAPHPCLFNIQNDDAQTPLHLAALTAQPKILRMLLIAGAEPTIRDRHGNTALHLACISGEEQCVRALIIPISASEINEAHRQYGHRSNDKTVSYLSCARLPSDLEIRNYDGERCVHLAAEAGYIDILRILVLYGADINAREGKSGRTPLHIAIESCNEDLANFLVDDCQKLNIETATYAGLTAYQVACILNKSQFQNILEKRGAEPLTPPDSDYDSSDIEDLEDTKIHDCFGDPGYFVGYNGANAMTVA